MASKELGNGSITHATLPLTGAELLLVLQGANSREASVDEVVARALSSGAIVQSVMGVYTTNANLATVIPLDDTIPQNTEGTQILSVAITPKSITNKLRARFQGSGAHDFAGATNIQAALFRSGVANALAASIITTSAAGFLGTITLEAEWVPGSLATQTITVRAGPGGAYNIRFNGNSGGRLLGGSMAATLVVEEIKA